jgi:hypothetical protein
MSFVETSLSGYRLICDYSALVRRLLPAICVALAVIALTGCGPTGPGDPGGTPSDPVYLLSVLPTPNGLVDVARERRADATDLVDAMLGSDHPEQASSVDKAGVARAALRRWSAPSQGTMVASVSVWRGHQVASNVAVSVGQAQLGGPGVAAWTPRETPGSTGTRSDAGNRVRVLARAVGPNVFVVRATGGASDDVVIRTLQRLIEVQGGVSN